MKPVWAMDSDEIVDSEAYVNGQFAFFRGESIKESCPPIDDVRNHTLFRAGWLDESIDQRMVDAA